MLFELKPLIRVLGLRPRSVLHLGAHLGEEAAAYAESGIRDVVWVEGNPELIEPLRAAVEPYGHRVVQALVSDRAGERVSFHVTNNFQSSSLLPLGTHRRHHPEVTVTHTLELATTTLDELIASEQLGGFDFMNLDLQGAELRALRGAEAALGAVDQIFTEVNREAVYEGCALVGELDEFLEARGFERVVTRWTKAHWGDALYVRGGVSAARRGAAAVLRPLLLPGRLHRRRKQAGI